MCVCVGGGGGGGEGVVLLYFVFVFFVFFMKETLKVGISHLIGSVFICGECEAIVV